jgi:beta-glucosidase
MFSNLTKAHCAAYRILHQQLPNAQVGTCLDYVAYLPNTNNLIDRLATSIIRFIGNNLFNLLTSKNHDFIGVNYYFQQKISRKEILNATTKNELNVKIMGEEGHNGSYIYPEGIHQVLTKLWQKYRLPIYITENGVAGDDNKRKKFITEHLKWIHKAIENGIDVRGYFYWSLLDNFEWSFGFKPRFGLIEVNYQNYQRTPRSSAYLYGQICKDNCLEI